MPSSRVSSSSTLVDVVSKAPRASWSKWDPGNAWSAGFEYKLTAQPRGGYCFPEYLGHDADCGPYRLGAIFSESNDLDTILFVPKAVPKGCHISTSGPGVFAVKKNIRIRPEHSSPLRTVMRQFRFQQLEEHCTSLKSRHLDRMTEDPSVKKILNRHFGSRSVYIITGLKIVHGLEVSDGEFYRKFDGPVIFSYRMHKLKEGPQAMEEKIVSRYNQHRV